ncbi:hypothetical protein HNV11_14745 [Spirosoma taeanense]|uniref:Uncharacterized protein n=1 Tax=Spirosoma taeanense TaxID=2735870 RepID=A0A6M5Y8B4_9BACT|nr:hypothetical protein [Spirosoma taeanense]QJW90547.1 hypothetical protein HNV11_14745 [Spirosoma taeanense]
MKRCLVFLIPLALAGWVLTDLLIPRQVNLRHFEPEEVARLDGAMWRSYYEKKPLLLFWQSARLIREQMNAPFWRSFIIAYHAAKAAFLFKNGSSRLDYNQALPDLEAFYTAIGNLSDQPLNVTATARNELEWWIIRRERKQHPPAEWAALQAQIAADLYHIPVASCLKYGQLRTEAMVFRDHKGEAITESDWQHVDSLLNQSWQSLAKSLS